MGRDDAEDDGDDVADIADVIQNYPVKEYVQLFRSARTSCTTFGWSRPSVRAKNLDHLYTGIYEKTHQTNPMAPWDPLDALLTPWDPLATPQSIPSDP